MSKRKVNSAYFSYLRDLHMFRKCEMQLNYMTSPKLNEKIA